MTDNEKIQQKYDAALKGLKKNTRTLHHFEQPVLIEGGIYPGIWLECGPLESTIYGMYEPDIALASHRIFFKHQREDGYFHTTVFKDRLLAPGQIQMVVPIAATALETALQTNDEGFIHEAYHSCRRWDEWLSRHRNTRGTGLCELFCAWDTGHDHSPRLKGIPHDCPERDARICNREAALPYLAPDLSASVYGGRLALAEMALLLNRKNEADMWREKAEEIRKAILAYCFDPEDLFFYDLDNNNRFVRVKGDVLTRVLGEHVVDRNLFDEIFETHILNADEFWTPYPLPSIAANDTAFDGNFRHNAWAGASQALTALRAPRWFEYYQKPAHLVHLMKTWVKSLTENSGFKQQINPWTGESFESEGYSPAMCVLLEFVSRLYGIRYENDTVIWNCTFSDHISKYSYSIETPKGTAKMDKDNNMATLTLAGKVILKVNKTCRIITDRQGGIMKIIGTSMDEENLDLFFFDRHHMAFTIKPNEEKEISRL